MRLTESDNQYLEYYKGKPETKVEEIQKVMRQGKVNKDYVESSDEELETAAQRVLEKLKLVSSETLQWFEVLLAFVFSIIAYMSPIWLLIFQVKMRQLEMEDEVMQF